MTDVEKVVVPQVVPVNDEIHKFCSIENFRDLSGVLTQHGIASNIIFRSATLDIASKQDIEDLISKYSIHTILDLRSKDDADTKTGPFSIYPRMRKPRLRARINTAASQVKSKKQTRRRVVNRGLASKTIMINFTGRKYQKFVWGKLDKKERVKLAFLRIASKDKAAKLVGKVVLNEGGLGGLYSSFIDYSGKAICMALKVLVSEMNYPILIHCAQGKDRTGIVIALSLAIIGIDEETIVHEYVQSQVGLEKIHDQVVHEMANKGLCPEFADSPPEVMKAMFQHIRTKYGSLDSYLDSITFTDEYRKALKRTLLHGAKKHVDSAPLKKPAHGKSNP